MPQTCEGARGVNVGSSEVFTCYCLAGYYRLGPDCVTAQVCNQTLQAYSKTYGQKPSFGLVSQLLIQLLGGGSLRPVVDLVNNLLYQLI